MISMSRVRDDTPQPTMSVTDGAAAFSMLCGSGRGTENRVRGGQTCGGRRATLLQHLMRSLGRGLISSQGRVSVPATGIIAWQARPQRPPHFRKGPPASQVSSPRQQAQHPPWAPVPDPVALQRQPRAGTWLWRGAAAPQHPPQTPALHPGPPWGSANSSCPQRPLPPPCETTSTPGTQSPPLDSKPGPAAPSAQIHLRPLWSPFVPS